MSSQVDVSNKNDIELVMRGTEKLIEFFDDHNWGQGAPGLTKEGEGTYASDPDACSWCVLGGMFKCTGDYTVALKFSNQFNSFIGQPIAHWNDARKQTKESIITSLKEFLEETKKFLINFEESDASFKDTVKTEAPIKDEENDGLSSDN